jgi:hypothetical protein
VLPVLCLCRFRPCEAASQRRLLRPLRRRRRLTHTHTPIHSHHYTYAYAYTPAPRHSRTQVIASRKAALDKEMGALRLRVARRIDLAPGKVRGSDAPQAFTALYKR